MGDVIRRTDFIQKQAGIAFLAAVGHPDHRITGMLVDNAGQFFGDFLERLVPGNRLKFSIGPAFHRLANPVFVIKICGYAMRAGA